MIPSSSRVRSRSCWSRARVVGALPDALEVVGETPHGGALVGAELTGAASLTASELGWRRFELAQPLLPFRLEASGDEAIFGFDGAITPFGPFGIVTRPFPGEGPLLEGGVVVTVELLGSAHGSLDAGGLKRVDDGAGDGLVNWHAADMETIHAPPVDEVLAGARIARRGVGPG